MFLLPSPSVICFYSITLGSVHIYKYKSKAIIPSKCNNLPPKNNPLVIKTQNQTTIHKHLVIFIQ